MIYEFRSYEVIPGRMPALHARFQAATMRLLAKHGIKVIGCWEAAVGQSNVLNWIVAYDSLAHREKAWPAFANDPEWIKARDASHQDGWIVARVRNEIWQPTAYSPLQ